MESIARIDRTIYACVTDPICTEEVVLTEERITHIQAHHPGVYEKYGIYIREIIEKPDYILEDTRPNTAIVLKHIHCENENFRLALRLVTISDNPTFQNSVITFMKIREKEWKREIKNKNILYKRE